VKKPILQEKKILIFGACGMLGQEFVSLLKDSASELVLADMQENSIQDLEVVQVDICDASQVSKLVSTVAPEVVINCAAYTQVDLAQEEPLKAFAVNALGVKNIAAAVASLNDEALMVHFSTDYVFSGDKGDNNPLDENAPKLPCGVYGLSKLLGDEFVQLALPKQHLILRTSWLHGTKGKSFVETIYKLSHERDELRVVDDQYGAPTWAPWLAETSIALIKKGARGLFNASSKGTISWFDFATEIVRVGGGKSQVAPQSTEELGRPAPRPVYSALDTSKLEQELGKGAIMDWKDCVKNHLEIIIKKG